jgi:hypothetical protein
MIIIMIPGTTLRPNNNPGQQINAFEKHRNKPV